MTSGARVSACHGAVDPEDSAAGAAARMVRQDAEAIFAACDRARRGELPRVAAAILRHEYLEREEANGKVGLHAQ